MEDGSRLPWICAVLLLFCAMYFAAAETAFASASRARLRVAEDRGDRRAREALYVLDHFDRAIGTLLIGTNIVHLAAASLITVAVMNAFSGSADFSGMGDFKARISRVLQESFIGVDEKGVEAAARELRYAFLRKTAAAVGATDLKFKVICV